MKLQVELSPTEVEAIVARELLKQFPNHKAEISLNTYGTTKASLGLEPAAANVLAQNTPVAHPVSKSADGNDLLKIEIADLRIELEFEVCGSSSQAVRLAREYLRFAKVVRL